MPYMVRPCDHGRLHVRGIASGSGSPPKCPAYRTLAVPVLPLSRVMGCAVSSEQDGLDVPRHRGGRIAPGHLEPSPSLQSALAPRSTATEPWLAWPAWRECTPRPGDAKSADDCGGCCRQARPDGLAHRRRFPAGGHGCKHRCDRRNAHT